MVDVINQKLKFDYENSASASYLVAVAEEGVKIKQFQIEMIAANPIKGILPLDLRNKNNILQLYYNITSKQVLSQFLSRKKLFKSEFVEILSDMVSALIKSGSYLLSEQGFLMHEDYIYINPSTRDVYFVYVPADIETDTVKNFKDFIIRMIVYLVTIDDRENDNFLQRILASVRQENFNLADFDLLLNEMKLSKTAKPDTVSRISLLDTKESAPPEYKEEQKTAKPQIKSMLEANKKQSSIEQKTESKIQIPGKSTMQIAIPPKNQDRAKTNVKSEANKTESFAVGVIKELNPKVIAVLLQVLIIIGFVLGSGYFKKLTNDTVASYAGTAIILIAVDFLVLRKILDKNIKIQGNENETKKRGSVKAAIPAVSIGKVFDMGKREISNEEIKRPENVNTPAMAGTAGVNRVPYKMGDITANLKIPSDTAADETTFLSARKLKYPKLDRLSDGIPESINITKPSFIIGRLKEQADYVSQNNAVGKVHAEILSKNGEYFVIDMNSRNGTCVNGIRIPSNKEYGIKNNDRIAFANTEYTFIVPEV